MKGISRVDATLTQIIDRYKELEFPLLRKSSQQARASRFKYLIDSPISELPMHQVCSEALDRWVVWLFQHPTCKDPQRSSFRQELKLMTTILNWYRENYDYSYPIPILRRHRKRCFESSASLRVPDYYMKPQEVLLWFKELEKRPAIIYSQLARFMILTGTRLGEACGLKWDALDTDFCHVRIIRTLSWDYVTKSPYFVEKVKTKAARRIIQLPPSLQEMFCKMRHTSHSQAIFVNNKGKLLSDNTIRANFNVAFKKLGLPWRGTHICRHTSGTLALLAKQDIATVQALLGHSSIKQTQEYAKVVALQGTAVAQATEDFIGLS